MTGDRRLRHGMREAVDAKSSLGVTRPSRHWLVNKRALEDDIEPFQRLAGAVLRDAMFEVADALTYLKTPCALFWVQILGADPEHIWAVATQNMTSRPATPRFEEIRVVWRLSFKPGIEELSGCRVSGHAMSVESAQLTADDGVGEVVKWREPFGPFMSHLARRH